MPTNDEPLRLAMWSGPRNISTALMRSWGSRPDCVVCDEPFYAHYLQSTTAKHHPGYDEVIAAHETDWRRVVEQLLAPLPAGKTIFYQKQMAHHILPHIQLDWVDHLSHCLLIREPREMLTSLIEFLPSPRLEETGLPHQLWLFEHFQQRAGTPPPVIDSRDVLENPQHVLRLLCDALSVEFLEDMLHWQPGLRETDGAWAPYWYDKVAETTSFGPYRPKPAEVPSRLLPLLDECQAIYDQLYQARLY